MGCIFSNPRKSDAVVNPESGDITPQLTQQRSSNNDDSFSEATEQRSTVNEGNTSTSKPKKDTKKKSKSASKYISEINDPQNKKTSRTNSVSGTSTTSQVTVQNNVDYESKKSRSSTLNPIPGTSTMSHESVQNNAENGPKESNERKDERQIATEERDKEILLAEIKTLKNKLETERGQRDETEKKLQKAIQEMKIEKTEREEKEKMIKGKDDENKRYKTEKAINEQEISRLRSELDDLKKVNPDRPREEMNKQDEKKWKKQYERVNNDLKEREKEIQRLNQEKEELYLRLSALAGRKLTDNNPNIADLSDVNRPTKIAENYSQLYDNEWTDAFQELESLQEYETDGEKEQKIIKVLFETIVIAYEVTLEKAMSELEKLNEAIHAVGGDEDEAKDLIKQLKDRRKKERVFPDDDLKQKYESKVKQQFPKIPSDKPDWIKYRDACINITWLMSIQDPPVYLECGDEVCKSGDKHDRSRYREYTKSGDLIDYPVWPALYIQRGGSMLGKGVAQCKRSMSASVQVRTTRGKKTSSENQSLSQSFHGTPSMEISTQSNSSLTTNL